MAGRPLQAEWDAVDDHERDLQTSRASATVGEVDLLKPLGGDALELLVGGAGLLGVDSRRERRAGSRVCRARGRAPTPRIPRRASQP